MIIKSFLKIMFYDPDKGWVEDEYEEVKEVIPPRADETTDAKPVSAL